MANVELKGVVKRFRAAVSSGRMASSVQAVGRLDLVVPDGSLTVLVGPSGCGKTTTLRLIAGLESPDEGEVWIGDRLVHRLPPHERNVALVFQGFALYPHLTVEQNLSFGLKWRRRREVRSAGIWKWLPPYRVAGHHGIERSEIKDRVQQTARKLGIEELLNRMPGQLSGGERQRVALGRAMVRRPAVFLLDEPLSNLDAPLRLEMRREIKELHYRERTTMVYVTHDQSEAMALGDRLAVMDCGQIQQIGEPQEIYDRPANRFVAGFLGSPPINFLDGEIGFSPSGIQFQCSDLGPRLAIPLDAVSLPGDVRSGHRVVLGIRPEDLRIGGLDASEGEASQPILRGRVTVVQPLGDLSLVSVEVLPDLTQGDVASERAIAKWTCKMGPRAKVEPGDVCGLRFNLHKVHVFDWGSGENLAMVATASAV